MKRLREILLRPRPRHALAQVRPESCQPRARTLDDMPAPHGQPELGFKLHEYVDRCHRQLGPIFKDQIGPLTAVFVADPTEMRRVFALEGKYPLHFIPEAWRLYNEMYGCKRGLFFMDGEEWLNTRRIMNALMIKPDKANAFVTPCRTTAKALADHWRKSKAVKVQELEEQLYRWSLDTIIATLMGSHYEVHARKWTSKVEKLSSVVHRIFLESGRMSIVGEKHACVNRLPVWNRFVDAVDTTLKEATALLLEIKATCAVGSQDGLLSQLLDAGIPEEDVVKIVVDLIIAAGDTTALSMQWALFLLAKNKEVQEEVLRDLLQHSDSTLSPLLRGVVRETLRLYPVAPFLTRIMPEPTVIGGYQLPPMQCVLISLYSSGRDPTHFHDPDRFWPGRWIRDQENKVGGPKAVINPHASLPFAMGARSCVGRKLAEIQMMTTLAEVLENFELELLNKEKIEMILHLVSVPSKPIEIGIKARK